jgi:hypothetical protein
MAQVVVALRATTFCASRLGVLECTSFGISKSLCMYVFGLCGVLECRSYTPTDWFGVCNHSWDENPTMSEEDTEDMDIYRQRWEEVECLVPAFVAVRRQCLEWYREDAVSA